MPGGHEAAGGRLSGGVFVLGAERYDAIRRDDVTLL